MAIMEKPPQERLAFADYWTNAYVIASLVSGGVAGGLLGYISQVRKPAEAEATLAAVSLVAIGFVYLFLARTDIDRVWKILTMGGAALIAALAFAIGAVAHELGLVVLACVTAIVAWFVWSTFRATKPEERASKRTAAFPAIVSLVLFAVAIWGANSRH